MAGRLASAAASSLVTGPGVQATGLSPMACTGITPRTALVTNTSLASASWARVSAPVVTSIPLSRAVFRTAARVTPGRIRPSAGGVRRLPFTTAKTLARSVSSTSPPVFRISSCSPGPWRCCRVSSRSGAGQSTYARRGRQV